jgi:hypothetical protein
LNRIAYYQSNRSLILLDRAETEICFWMANGMVRKKTDIDCHRSQNYAYNCQHLDPPYFSSLTIPLCNNLLAHISDPNVKKWIKLLFQAKVFYLERLYGEKKSQESKQFESPTWVWAPLIDVPHAVSQKVGISEVRQRNLKSKKTFTKETIPKLRVFAFWKVTLLTFSVVQYS